MAGTLDQNEGEFVRGIHNATGIDERVVIAWMYQEGAFKKGGTGGYNYLNIRSNSGDFAHFSNVQDAITATVAVLRQPNMRTIVSMAKTKPTPQQQINAIAASPWDAAHYGGSGGPTLQKTFAGLFGGTHSLTTPYLGADIAADFKATAADFTSIDMNTVTGAVGDAVGAVVSPIASIAHAFEWAFSNWDRILLVIGGGIGLLVAIILIFKSQSGQNTFTFSRGE